MSIKYGTGNDPYCYNGTDVLINKLNIKNNSILENAEAELSQLSLESIDFTPPPYNFLYLQKIHKTLFGDLYDWAGSIRTIGMNKGDTMFCRPEYIQNETDKVFIKLAKNNYFLNIPHNSFINSIAELYGDLNIIHPFREGNGRSQRILFEHIIVNAGYKISWMNVSKDEWIQANINSVGCDYELLENIFTRCISN
ncbi:MAG: putative adenosine monophosphate-protein transferase Fic [Cognaticolwellia sp.]